MVNTIKVYKYTHTNGITFIAFQFRTVIRKVKLLFYTLKRSKSYSHSKFQHMVSHFGKDLRDFILSQHFKKIYLITGAQGSAALLDVEKYDISFSFIILTLQRLNLYHVMVVPGMVMDSYPLCAMMNARKSF